MKCCSAHHLLHLPGQLLLPPAARNLHQPACLGISHTPTSLGFFFFFGSVFCFSLAGDPLRKTPLISSGLRNLVLSLDHMALQHAEKQHSRPRGIWDCSGTHSAMVTYRELSLSSSVVHSCFLLLCLTPILQFIECGGEP